MRWSLILVLSSLVGLAAGCDRASGAAPATKVMSKPTVAKIVFVGKQNACDCTRKTIDTSLKALEAGLGTKNRIPVEHLKMDTQPDQVAVYRNRKPFMALPAIYFLDQTDSLVELLQGEVTQEQVAKVLQ